MTVVTLFSIVGAIAGILIGLAAIWRGWGWDRTSVALGVLAVALGTVSLIITAFRLGYAGWP